MLHKHLERKKKKPGLNWGQESSVTFIVTELRYVSLSGTGGTSCKGKRTFSQGYFYFHIDMTMVPAKLNSCLASFVKQFLSVDIAPPPHVTIFAFLILSVGNLSSCLVMSKHGKCKNILSFLIHYQDNSDQCIEDKHGLLKPSSAADKLACLWGAGLCPLLMGTSCHASLGAQREEKVTSSFPPVNAWG